MPISLGRPRASSRETLAEAACELFLEQGYAGTSITDIATRAGVSRSSFFNYFAAKADILWAGLDERIDGAVHRLAALQAPFGSGYGIPSALRPLAEDFTPDSLALALVNAIPMGLSDELEREASVRQARLAAAVSACLVRADIDSLSADVAGAAHAGAVLAAINAWAREGAGQGSMQAQLDRALVAAGPTLPPAASTEESLT